MRAKWVVPVLMLAGCVTLPPLTQGQLSATTEKWPGTDLAQLQEGRGLYKTRCNKCHPLMTPARLRKESWPDVFEEMTDNAKLTPTEKDRVEHFLWALTLELPDGGAPVEQL